VPSFDTDARNGFIFGIKAQIHQKSEFGTKVVPLTGKFLWLCRISFRKILNVMAKNIKAVLIKSRGFLKISNVIQCNKKSYTYIYNEM
jgi:hypothetical protein